MSAATHSPGTWTVCDGAILSDKLNDYGNFIVVTLARVLTPQDRANLALMAAAPALLANLKMMTDLAERYGVGEHCDGNIIEARDLIASIEGEAPNCPGYAGPCPAGMSETAWLAFNNID